MYLSELNIVGFKSFARKVNVVFNDGITAVVGPNGCGKSNVVDAIRWVMGEQRSGVLRSERMENVIFNGSASSKPVGMAEVALKIENTKNILPVEYSEVVITRRLFRSGESQYLINGNQVRLKDILDLFMDTGVGPGTYSVIELPMVERILNGKDDERRKIFEEAAGITKYKLRRRATFRKLDATEKDLLRIDDIMSEVEKTVRSLRRQVSRAERYQEMTKELRQLDIQLATHEFNTLATELEPLQTQLELLQGEREEAASHLATFDAEYESMRTRLLEIEKKLAEEQKSYNTLEREVQKFDERILINKERLRSLEENRSRYDIEQSGFQKRLSGLREEREHVENRRSTAEEKRNAKQQDYDRRNAEYQEIRGQYDEVRNELKRVELDLLKITEEISSRQNQGERLKANEENLSHRISELEAEEKRYDERYRELIGQLTEARSDEEKLLRQLEETRKKLTKTRNQEEEARSSYDGLHKSYLQDQNRIEVLENQAALVRRLIENFEDYPAGVRYLAQKDQEEYKSYGPLANVLRIKDEFRRAIAAALGEIATYLVVENSDNAFKGIELLKQDRKGIVSFLPVNKIAPLAPLDRDLDDLGVVGWASEVVSCDTRFRQVVDNVLGSFLIVQDLQTAHRLYDEAKEKKIHLVTLSGDLLTAWGVIRGGSGGKEESEFIGRQEQLANLESEIESIQQASEKRQRSMIELDEQAQAAGIEADELETEIKAIEDKLAAKRIELGRLNYEEQTLTESREKREQEREKLVQALGQIDENLKEQHFGTEDLQQKRQRLNETAEKLRESLKQLEERVSAFGEDVQSVSVELARLQSEHEALQRESESLKRQIGETENMIESRTLASEQAEQEIKELNEVNEEYAARVKSLQERMKGHEHVLDQYTDQQYELNSALAEREKEIRASRVKSENLSNTLHNHEMRVSELKLKLESLRTRIWEEYEHELSREEDDEAIEVEAVREKVHTLREKVKDFGPVNLLALKEYEQEKERLDFLVSQKNDLLDARKNLTETIDVINKTAREKFHETFEQIQKNFSQVFKTFFEGGRASLLLRDTEDPLESDIDIYATPGGKRLSALTLLSGGEKSLTAISLLFAIYLVKPSPFCILDEVDAPLDDQNVRRFTSALKQFSDNTQFILVTHNKLSMRAANQLYGVTMQEEGVSKVVSVQFEKDTDDVHAQLAPVSKN